MTVDTAQTPTTTNDQYLQGIETLDTEITILENAHMLIEVLIQRAKDTQQHFKNQIN